MDKLKFVQVGVEYINPKYIVSLKFFNYSTPYQIWIELSTGRIIEEDYCDKSEAESVFEKLTESVPCDSKMND